MSDWMEGPILFLDIDGVLNSNHFMRQRLEAGEKNVGHALDPDAVAQLQRIVDATGCSIVLSSTWRLIHTLADMRGRLIEAGMRSPVPLRDKTPNLDTKGANGRRGSEVQAWIDRAGFEGRFCCVDDDDDFQLHHNLVRTDHVVGMTKWEADQCIKFLRPAATVGDRP